MSFGCVDTFRALRVAALVAASCTESLLAHAQPAPDPSFTRRECFDSFQEFKDHLFAISREPDEAKRQPQLGKLWEKLKAAGQVPYVQGDRVAFLYRGAADRVTWVGDFNAWNPNAAGWQGEGLAGTDLWMLEKTFPEAARLDYKIVADQRDWVLDPANPLQVFSGFGANSELRMPLYRYPQETIRRGDTPRGKLSPPVTIKSANLGYDVSYRVYTPTGYEKKQLKDLPAAYVADGHEYAADALGAMVVVLDNAIAANELQPMLAVFIDPRDSSTDANRRHEQYVASPKFAAFVADELVPAVDAAYRTRRSPDARLILGTSLGGLAAAHLGATHPDVVGKVGVQSPADFARFAPGTLKLFESQPLQHKLAIYVTAGTFGDGNGGVDLTNVLKANRYDFKFVQVNEGHSWGAWRSQLKPMLVKFFGQTGR